LLARKNLHPATLLNRSTSFPELVSSNFQDIAQQPESNDGVRLVPDYAAGCVLNEP
jgi:hypothetical protein